MHRVWHGWAAASIAALTLGSLVAPARAMARDHRPRHVVRIVEIDGDRWGVRDVIRLDDEHRHSLRGLRALRRLRARGGVRLGRELRVLRVMRVTRPLLESRPFRMERDDTLDRLRERLRDLEERLQDDGWR